MGRYSANPRYNIVSVRISDQDLEELNRLRDVHQPLSGLLLQAVRELLDNARQARIDEHLRACGVK